MSTREDMDTPFGTSRIELVGIIVRDPGPGIRDPGSGIRDSGFGIRRERPWTEDRTEKRRVRKSGTALSLERELRLHALAK